MDEHAVCHPVVTRGKKAATIISEERLVELGRRRRDEENANA